ncbi:hypothetical protein COB55_02330 [Candidatus Wolfebacteria bacterium]|nr:MAG: hypothetical protein COB55_02330 [Candidatus Wolfebacteria bacterium]
MIKEKYTIKDFYPLIGLFVIILLLSTGATLHNNMGGMFFMQMFMGWFFILFGVLKVINIKAFAESYAMYDIIAARSRVYAFVYPFIELTLGVLFLFGTALFYTNIVTLVVMLIGALGVYLQLRKGETIMCACLGTVFKVPMTWVTLFEDLLMAGMALIMLLNF